MRPVELETQPEPCESCGTRVAVTRRVDDGARRWSEISDAGRVKPGGHSRDACQARRGR